MESQKKVEYSIKTASNLNISPEISTVEQSITLFLDCFTGEKFQRGGKMVLENFLRPFQTEKSSRSTLGSSRMVVLMEKGNSIRLKGTNSVASLIRVSQNSVL